MGTQAGGALHAAQRPALFQSWLRSVCLDHNSDLYLASYILLRTAADKRGGSGSNGPDIMCSIFSRNGRMSTAMGRN